jgi:hypothetical protein
MENNSPWQWMRSAWFLVLFLSLALPFVTVSDVPGGFGRVDDQGTTTYSAFDVGAGREPRISGADEVGGEARRQDTIPAQPLVLLAVAGVIGAAAASMTINDRRQRHLVSSVLSVATLALLAAGQWVGQLRLTDLVTEQMNATGANPGDKATGDFVTSGYGFWVLVVGLAVVAAVDLAMLWRDDRREPDVDRSDAEVSRHLESSLR